MNGKRVGLYLRVSTDEQTVENQGQALTEAIERRGWRIVDTFEDNGVSGAKGREKRPGYDRLVKAATNRKIDVVAAWSVDRLGRSLQDLVGFLAELNAVGCDLYLEKQAVDTTTPAGRALFQMLGMFAEFERAILQERIHAGIARARRNGTKSGKPIGRPKLSQRKIEAVVASLTSGRGIHSTARAVGVGVGTVQRITEGPMAHKVYEAIVRAIRAGRLTEPFSKEELRAECPNLGQGTYNAFLWKHQTGNGKTSELFELVSPWRFRCIRPFLYGL